MPNIVSIVDLDRYPIDKLDSAAAVKLIATCQEALDSHALCSLPGFILADALQAMAREGSALEDVAYPYAANRIAYEEPDHSLPADHPRNAAHPCSYRQLLNHQISNESSLRKIYTWAAMTEFLRRILKVGSLHHSACPHLALTMQLARQGDGNGWHFDGNDFVVSLLLQAPERGGEFEYAPNVRSRSDERYEDVSRVLADPDKYAERPSIEPGMLTLFKGDLSLHRVRTVGETALPRIIAVFSYDERPGQVFSQGYIDEVRGIAAAAAPA